jgi:hypothetical protein
LRAQRESRDEEEGESGGEKGPFQVHDFLKIEQIALSTVNSFAFVCGRLKDSRPAGRRD